MSGVIAYLYRMASKRSRAQSEEDPMVIMDRIVDQYIEILDLEQQAREILIEARQIPTRALLPSKSALYEERQRIRKAIERINAIKAKAKLDNIPVADPRISQLRLEILTENLQATPQQHAEALQRSLLRNNLVKGRNIRQDIHDKLLPKLKADLELFAKQSGFKFSDENMHPMDKAAELLDHLAANKDDKPRRKDSTDDESHTSHSSHTL